MTWSKKRILVAVKAYPNPSKTYGETVCVAGIDLDTGKWTRLYPIPFRDLEDTKQFKKYSIIEVATRKATEDKRPESYKVDTDTIKILNRYGTANGWKHRREVLLPTKSPSFCKILEESASVDKSLGMIKPTSVNFSAKKLKNDVQCDRDACYAQLSFYNKQKDTIEKIPFDFRLQFKCEEKDDCPGHDLPIIDWEIGQAYRLWRHQYKDESELLEKIKQKWLLELCSANNDTHFFVGNMKRFRQNFMILGVFYPPLSHNLKLF